MKDWITYIRCDLSREEMGPRMGHMRDEWVWLMSVLSASLWVNHISEPKWAIHIEHIWNQQTDPKMIRCMTFSPLNGMKRDLENGWMEFPWNKIYCLVQIMMRGEAFFTNLMYTHTWLVCTFFAVAHNAEISYLHKNAIKPTWKSCGLFTSRWRFCALASLWRRLTDWPDDAATPAEPLWPPSGGVAPSSSPPPPPKKKKIKYLTCLWLTACIVTHNHRFNLPASTVVSPVWGSLGFGTALAGGSYATTRLIEAWQEMIERSIHYCSLFFRKSTQLSTVFLIIMTKWGLPLCFVHFHWPKERF